MATAPDDRITLLTEASARLLTSVLDLHGQLLALTHEDRIPTAQDRLDAWFQPGMAPAAETALRADAAVAPGIVVSFEDGSGCVAQLARAPNATGHGPDRLILELLDPGRTGWFTLEVAMPWTEARRARALRLAVASHASRLLDCRAIVRAIDTQDRNVELGTTRLTLPEHPAVTQTSFRLLLPHTVRFNEATSPRLIFFFDLAPFRVELDYVRATPE